MHVALTAKRLGEVRSYQSKQAGERMPASFRPRRAIVHMGVDYGSCGIQRLCGSKMFSADWR